eukprot:2039446-Lingulodinium_polyedra.AAC.1
MMHANTDNISRDSVQRKRRTNFFSELPAKWDIHKVNHSFWSGPIAACNSCEPHSLTIFNALTP